MDTISHKIMNAKFAHLIIILLKLNLVVFQFVIVVKIKHLIAMEEII